MDDLKKQIISIINGALVKEEPDQVNALVEHLTSRTVQVETIGCLKDLDRTMLDGVTSFGALPLKNIWTALITAGKAASRNTTSSSDQTSEESEAGSSQQDDVDNDDDDDEDLEREKFTDDEFKFDVNWNDLPREIVKALRAAKRKNVEGKQADVVNLKKALAVKIIASYDAFRKANPLVKQKTPGVKVYKDVAKQVVKELRVAMRVSLNKVVMCKGVPTFTKNLNVQIENHYRPPAGSKETSAGIRQGKGVPGVLADQYYPQMKRQERNRGVILQKELQAMELLDDDEKDWVEICSKMSESYKLQRELVVHSTKAILREEDDHDDSELLDNEEETEDSPAEEKLVEKIKRAWPFLFTFRPMCNHHQTLTGRDLDEKFNSFFDSGDLKYLITFLTSCSQSNLTNAIMKLKLDDQLPNMTNGSKLLLTVCMLANHFKETWEDVLLLKVEERTTLASEVEASVGETMPNSICIVALGENAFSATSLYICVDKVCVAETSNAGNALLILLQLCFILDLEYPSGLGKTFEFIERIILEMAPQDTKVRNKGGKILLVLTHAVMSVAKSYVDFKTQAKKN